MKKWHFNIYVPATDQNPTARSEYEMLIKAAVPDAKVVFVETVDDEDL